MSPLLKCVCGFSFIIARLRILAVYYGHYYRDKMEEEVGQEELLD